MSTPANTQAADLPEIITKALSKAFGLGQTYWQQADSEYTSQHRKADETHDKYRALVAETVAELTLPQAAEAGISDELLDKIAGDSAEAANKSNDNEAHKVIAATREQDSFHVASAESGRVQGEGLTDEQIYHQARGDYEIAQIRRTKGTRECWPKFCSLTPIEQAGWVARSCANTAAGAGGSVGATKSDAPPDLIEGRFYETTTHGRCR